MNAANATEPAKKRGRPKKVVTEDVEAKSVRKASTKTSAKKEDAGVKKTPKPATKSTSTTTTATKASKAVKTTKSAAASKANPKAKATVVEEVKKKPEPVVATQVSPVTPATSRILEEVAKTGTLKTKAVPKLEPTAHAQVVSEPAKSTPQAGPLSASSQSKPSTPPTPTPTPTPFTAPPSSAAKPTSSMPPTTPPPTSIPKATPPPPPSPSPLKTLGKPSSLPPRSTTIPLPRKPINPFTYSASAPASPRPKPLSEEALEKKRDAQAISEGRMPQKYKPAARRVVAIMVGIPVIIVTGWELWRRWDKTIRTKFETVEKRAL